MSPERLRGRVTDVRRVARARRVGRRAARELAGQLDDVRAFVAFVGYSRSGHSLVAALLDAHRNAAIAHEEHALLDVAARLPRERLLARLVANTREVGHSRGHSGSRSGGYRYDVGGQWQGRWERLEVVGDKDGEDTTCRLAASPRLATALERRVGVPVIWVHVVRNPFDNVASIAARAAGGGAADLAAAARRYLWLSRAVERALASRAPANVVEVRHERLVADPRAELRSLCGSLALDADRAYLDACAAIVLPAPLRARDDVSWPGDVRAAIEQRIREVEFLGGYALEEPRPGVVGDTSSAT